jgi:hypothetical protein
MSYRGNEMETVNEKGETVKGVSMPDGRSWLAQNDRVDIFLLIVLRLLCRFPRHAALRIPAGAAGPHRRQPFRMH